jgi:FMN-dependent NADH-azoreductase
MFVIASRGDGGYAPGERNHKRALHEPLLREAFGMMGITDITFVAVENDDGGQKLADSIATARTQIAELVAA